jgi:hypothetical protein
VRKFGGELLKSTGLACALGREANKLVTAVGSLKIEQNELTVAASKIGVAQLRHLLIADEDLTDLEDTYVARQLCFSSEPSGMEL